MNEKTRRASEPELPSGPPYITLGRSGELARRAERAAARSRVCTLCPRDCRVDRPGGEAGVCGVAGLALVASAGPHFGEERCLVGRGGSGTIFFSGCNLACVFCQNYDISQVARPVCEADSAAGKTAPKMDAGASGREYSPEELAGLMLGLQELGCENINFVSPSHVVPQILAALVSAVDRGLTLPLVYNSGGYDSLQTLRLLDGVIDIYMPDMKYADNDLGRVLSGVPDYAVRNQAAVLEMHRQVGDLTLNGWGVARRGLLVRHLVLPGRVADAAAIALFLAERISPHTYVNLMDQYHPAHLVRRHPDRYPGSERRLRRDEYKAAIDAALAAGLTRLD